MNHRAVCSVMIALALGMFTATAQRPKAYPPVMEEAVT